MGDSRPAHKVGTFSSRADDLHIGEILPVVYSRDSPATWSTGIHSVNIDPRFMAHFGKSFQKAMATRLPMSTTFHPQTDGQIERIIQVLEDMLRACVLDHKGSWKEHFP